MTFEEKTVKSEILYEGRILNVRRDTVTVENGTSTREIVEHNGGSVIAAITKEHHIVMIRQYRKPVERVCLEVPAGKREAAEDPMETARRELREETGYRAGKMKLLTAMETSVGYSTEVLYVYLATELTPGETDFDENEAIDIEEYPLETVYQWAVEGKLRDSKTLVAVMLAKAALECSEKGASAR